MFDVIKDTIKKLSERKRILESCRDIAHQCIQCGDVVLDLGEAGREFTHAWIGGRSGEELERFLKVQKRLFDRLQFLTQASGQLAEETFNLVYGDRDVDHP